MNRRIWLLIAVLLLVSGALIGRRLQRPPPVPIQDQWEEEPSETADIKTGADRLAGGGAQPERARRKASSWSMDSLLAPKLLPDSVFKHPHGEQSITFEQAFEAVASPHVKFRALNQPEGSFLFDDQKGWLQFNGTRFVGIDSERVPVTVRQAAPVVTDPQTRKPVGLGPGDS
jgi:hypothetical protein